MTILKFSLFSKDAEYDIIFTEGGRFLRYGSDEDPKPGFKEAFRELCKVASVVAGVSVGISRVTWKRGERNQVTAVIEGLAQTKVEAEMKVKLPEIGWRKQMVQVAEDQWEERTFPINTDDEGIEALTSFEMACIGFIRDGSGQLDLFADSPEPKQEREVAERVVEFVNG